MKLTVKQEQAHSQQHRGSPRRQETPYLLKGSVVEVSSDEEGFKGAWYQATVLNNISLSKKRSPYCGKVHVEYLSLVSDKDRSKPLREYVSVEYVRPVPPVDSHPPGPFHKGDIVDAFYSDGWWTGVITNIVEGSKFKVTFQNPPDAGEFGASDLRVHREWVNGSWIPPAKQEVSIPSDYKIYDGFADKNGSSVGVTVPLSSSMTTKNIYDENTPLSSPSRMNKIELVTPSNDEPQVINSSPREMTLDARAVAPSTETNASSYNVSEILCNVASAEKDTQPLGAEQLSGSHSLQKNVKRKRDMFAEKEETATLRSRKTPEKKVQVKTLQNTAGGKEGNEADGVIEDVPIDCPVIETNLPVVLGLACVNSISSASKQSSRSNGKAAKCIGDWSSFEETVLHSVKVTKQFQVLNGTQKRGRGRPRKYVEPPLITPMLDVEGATSLETSNPGKVLGTKGSSEMHVDDQINQENQSDIKNVTSPLTSGGDNAVETLVKHQYVRQPAKRIKKRMINLNLISNVHDVASPTSGDGKIVEASCMTDESETVVAESPNNTHENQPLSKWFGDLNSPAEDSSRSDKTSKEDHMEIIKEDTTATATAAVNEILPVVAVKEPEKLPFEKKSPIWSALECMEVLQNPPQKPHFQPLENFKENVREGLAIGLMVTYTGVVGRTSNLKYDDYAKASIDDILETLMELETHGFDVGVVRERITGLGRMIERRENLEEEARKLKREVEENELEKARIEEEMEEMKKKMNELREKLSKATSMKEIKEGEIDSLHLKLMSVKEGMKNIRREFDQGNNETSSWLYGS